MCEKHTFTMSTALVQQPNIATSSSGALVTLPVATASKSKIEPWDPKELKSQLKDNIALYKKLAEGTHTPFPDEAYEAYIQKVKNLASLLLTELESFLQKYKDMYESIETKRVATIKPRLCDKKLTTFLANHFKRYLPDNGQHGILDLNRIAPRAISLYVKEKNLGETQFFYLDNELKALFESPSVENPQKTYLQLAQERITEIRMEKDYKQSVSSADIHIDHNRITMNYSALKIIIPKFGVQYDLTDPKMYEAQLEEFNKYLEELHNKHEEAKKAQKKAAKK